MTSPPIPPNFSHRIRTIYRNDLIEQWGDSSPSPPRGAATASIDDTTTIMPGKNWAAVIKIAYNKLNSVFHLLENYKLIVKAKKTKYMIRSRKPHVLTITNRSCIKKIKKKDL